MTNIMVSKFAPSNKQDWHTLRVTLEEQAKERRKRERAAPVHKQKTHLNRAGNLITNILHEMRDQPENLEEIRLVFNPKLKYVRQKIDPRTKPAKTSDRETINDLITKHKETLRTRFSKTVKNEQIEIIKKDCQNQVKQVEEAETEMEQRFTDFDNTCSDTQAKAKQALAAVERDIATRIALFKRNDRVLVKNQAIHSMIDRQNSDLAYLYELQKFLDLVLDNSETEGTPSQLKSFVWTAPNAEKLKPPSYQPDFVMEQIYEFESKNRRLIENLQEEEEEIVAVSKKNKKTLAAFDRDIELLRSAMVEMEANAIRYEERVSELQETCKFFDESDFTNSQENILEELEKRISTVFNDLTNNSNVEFQIDLLVMLKKIESSVIEIVDHLDSYEKYQIFITKRRRSLELQRKKEEQETEKQLQEAKLRQRTSRAIERASQVHRLKRGRKLVKRSVPNKEARKQADKPKIMEEIDQEYLYYFSYNS